MNEVVKPSVLPEPYASIVDREVTRMFKPARLIWAVVQEMGCDSFITDDSDYERNPIEILIREKEGT